MPEPLSRVVMLVHPLYSLSHSRASDLPPRLRVDLARSRKNIAFLLGVWGERIRRASRDPHSLVIVVKYDPASDHHDLNGVLPFDDPSFQNELKWLRARLDRFYRWIDFTMGPRVVFSNGTARSRAVRAVLKKRGLRMSLDWKGEAFGEYLHRCVHQESKIILGSWLDWVSPRLLRVKHSLSVEPLNASLVEKGGLGSMRSNIPLNARRIALRRKKRMRRK